MRELLPALIAFGVGFGCWIFYRIVRRGAPFGLADGLAYFCINMIVFLLTAPHLQNTYGLWGLLATEILLLLPALMMPRLTRTRPREFFQLYFPRAKHTAGGLLLWFGALLGASIGTSLLTMIFPQMQQEMQQVNNFLVTADLPLRLVAAVLAPAICEELMHRGVILASMRGRYRDAFISVTMGLIFGVFHMDPSRFLATAVLGMAITYAGLRAHSILLPMLIHLVNNFFSVAVGEMLSNQPELTSTPELDALPEATEAFMMLASQLMIAFLSLSLLLGGYMLLRDAKRPLGVKGNPILLIAAFMAVALLAQAGITAVRVG